MFTGIVQTRLPVCKIERKDDFATLIFEFPPEFLQGLQNGASVAINGTCLTVREIDADRVSFNAIDQTLKVTFAWPKFDPETGAPIWKTAGQQDYKLRDQILSIRPSSRAVLDTQEGNSLKVWQDGEILIPLP